MPPNPSPANRLPACSSAHASLFLLLARCMCLANCMRICGCRCATSLSPTASRSACMTPQVPIPTPMPSLTCAVAWPVCVMAGSRRVATLKAMPGATAWHWTMARKVTTPCASRPCVPRRLRCNASRAAPKAVPTSRRCTTPRRASSRPRWNTWPSVKTASVSGWSNTSRTLPVSSA